MLPVTWLLVQPKTENYDDIETAPRIRAELLPNRNAIFAPRWRFQMTSQIRGQTTGKSSTGGAEYRAGNQI